MTGAVGGTDAAGVVVKAFRVRKIRETDTGDVYSVRYTGTSLIRNSAPLAPFSRAMPRAPWWS